MKIKIIRFIVVNFLLLGGFGVLMSLPSSNALAVSDSWWVGAAMFDLNNDVAWYNSYKYINDCKSKTVTAPLLQDNSNHSPSIVGTRNWGGRLTWTSSAPTYGSWRMNFIGGYVDPDAQTVGSSPLPPGVSSTSISATSGSFTWPYDASAAINVNAGSVGVTFSSTFDPTNSAYATVSSMGSTWVQFSFVEVVENSSTAWPSSWWSTSSITFFCKVVTNNAPPTPTLIAPLNGAGTTSNWINYNPIFTATVTDPDAGDTVKAYFHFARVGVDPLPPGDMNGTTVSSGSNSTWTPSPALADGKYDWRATAIDSKGAQSGPTGYWRVKKDTSPPTASACTAVPAGTAITVSGITGTDNQSGRTNSGVVTIDLQRSVNAGAYSSVRLSTQTAPGAGVEEYPTSFSPGNYADTGVVGSNYSYRFVVTDRAGWSTTGPACGPVTISANILNVFSSPVGGVAITGTQAGTGGTTNTSSPYSYSKTISANISTTLTAFASVSSGGNSYNFTSWSGCDSTSGAIPSGATTGLNCTVAISGNTSKTVTVNYVLPRFDLTCTSRCGVPVRESVQQSQSYDVGFRITPVNGYTGNVALTWAFSPLDATLSGSSLTQCTSPQSISSATPVSCILRVQTTISTPTLNYTVTITGTDASKGLSSLTTSLFTVTTFVYAPWLQVSKGDVGSLSKLSSGGTSQSDYLIITSDDAISFLSLKKWLIKNPPLPAYNLKVNPPVDAGMFSSFKPPASPPATALQSDLGNLSTSLSGNKVLYSGDFTLVTEGDITYSGPPAVVFIDGNMTIISGLSIGTSTGIIFVVQGNVSIDRFVTNVDGVFAVGGNFKTTDNWPSCQNPTANDTKLTIHGAVYVAGTACFNRNLSLSNDPSNPAETIIYEPKYLWLFRDPVGLSRNIFREIAP